MNPLPLFLLLLVPTMQDDERPTFPEVKSPAFPAPTSLDEWKGRREQTRATLWKVLGDLPPRPATPQVRVVKQEEREGYRLEKLSIDNGAGARIPGWLLLPHGKGPFPAILYHHWHAGQYNRSEERRVGKE